MTTPNTFFTHTIHSPERGSVCSRFENVPSTRYGAPRPRARVKNDVNPNHGSPLAPTIASSATTGGPTHGAANTPTRSPDTNVPRMPLVVLPPSRFSNADGIWISYSPNIDNDSAMNRSPMPTCTAGFASTPPNRPPVKAATRPSELYMSAIPSTYTTARPNTWSGGAARRAPKIETVTP